MDEIIREVKFEYEKNKNPVDIFKEYTLMLSAFEKAEKAIAHTLSGSIQFKTALETIEMGSIITKIKSWIEDKAPDLGDGETKKIDIQRYISNGLEKIVNNLACDKSITKHTVEKISTDLEELAREIKVNESFSYMPMQPQKIIEVSQSIKEATANLSDNEAVYLSEDDGKKIELPKKLNIQVSEKDYSVESRTITNETEQILKVKKPDYMADSAWDLKIGKTIKSIKIEDSIWITKFLNKEIKLYPGDSIRCKVLCIEEYDGNGNLINSKISISRVLEVIEGSEKDEQK